MSTSPNPTDHDAGHHPDRRLPAAPAQLQRPPRPADRRIAASLRKFGQVRPIVTWRRYIIAGHGVVIAARSLGWTEIAAAMLPDDYPEHLALAYLPPTTNWRGWATRTKPRSRPFWRTAARLTRSCCRPSAMTTGS